MLPAVTDPEGDAIMKVGVRPFTRFLHVEKTLDDAVYVVFDGTLASIHDVGSKEFVVEVADEFGAVGSAKMIINIQAPETTEVIGSGGSEPVKVPETTEATASGNTKPVEVYTDP